MADGAYCQIVFARSQIGEHVQVGLDITKFQIDVRVMRMKLAIVNGVSRIKEAQSID